MTEVEIKEAMDKAWAKKDYSFVIKGIFSIGFANGMQFMAERSMMTNAPAGIEDSKSEVGTAFKNASMESNASARDCLAVGHDAKPVTASNKSQPETVTPQCEKLDACKNRGTVCDSCEDFNNFESA